MDEAIDKPDDVQLDTLVRAELHRVSVPTGLADQLKTAVRTELNSATLVSQELEGVELSSLPTVSNTTQLVEASNSNSVVDSESDHSLKQTWRRRAVVAFVLAASLLGFAWIAKVASQPVDRGTFARECIAILNALENRPNSWQQLDGPLPQSIQALRSQLVTVRILGQADLSEIAVVPAILQNADIAAFRLDAGDGVGLVLIELKMSRPVQGLTSRFATLPTPSGGWALAAMTQGDRTFVLAASSTERQLMSYIHQAMLT